MYNALMNTEENDEIIVKDAFGNILADGDSVVVVKDLKVKGTSATLKKGTKIKNIHLTDDEELIECNADGIKGLVLRVEFLKKA
jgi:protein PhnA